MSFKAEITLGQVIELAVFVIALVGTVRKFGAMEQKLNTMYDWFTQSVLHRERSVERFERPRL